MISCSCRCNVGVVEKVIITAENPINFVPADRLSSHVYHARDVAFV